ncbi:MAG: hypothetical protein AB2A00_34705 [Myxococcota bacterium]
MIDDEFLIEDEVSEDDGEEEDLLAGVATEHHDAWDAGPATHVDLPMAPAAPGQPAPATAEDLDLLLAPVEEEAATRVVATTAVTSPPPPPPAATRPAAPPSAVVTPARADAPPADADVDDLDLDMDEAPAVSQAALKNIKVLVVDPQQGWDGPLCVALQPFGFSLTVVETGVSAREELERNPYNLACLVVGQDAGWARMLLQRGRERFEHVRFMVVIPQGAAAMTQSLIELGASDVLEVPVPQGTSLLVRVQAVLPDLMPMAVADPKELISELALLRKRLLKAVADSESKANEMAARAQEAEQQLQRATVEVRQHQKEITGVRSELSVLRDRAQVLDERVERQKEEIAALKRRNGELEMALQQKQPEPIPAPTQNASLVELRSLFAALTPFGFGFDQALDFLSDLAVQVGPAAPQLQGHLNKLKLIRGVLKRIESKINQN